MLRFLSLARTSSSIGKELGIYEVLVRHDAVISHVAGDEFEVGFAAVGKVLFCFVDVVDL